ncbi:helix-turn-helix domain-containing protein, partial [Kitasatospora aureofaciens]
MASRPLTAKDRAAVKRLHAKGMSRNDIARAIKRSPST